MNRRMKQAILAALVLTFASPIVTLPAQAQSVYGQRNRVDSQRTLRMVERLETNTDQFKSTLDRALDDSRLNGSNREDNINQYVRDFERATDSLKDQVNDGDRAARAVREVVNRASRIDNIVQRRRLGQDAQRSWAVVRRDVSSLASLYGTRY